MIELKQSTAVTVPFEMVDDTGVAVLGITPIVILRKSGGSFAAATNTPTEVGYGVYQIALTATETDTLGPIIFSVSGAGAQTDRFQLEVVANKNDDLAGSIATVDTVADTIEGRITAARAGYLDKLNVSGTLAHSDAAATYQASGFAVPGDEMTLTAGERATLATTIEAALINEADGQQLINAILQAINSNLDLPAVELAAIGDAVRVELSTELARLDAAISSRLATGDYTAGPSAATIADAVWDESISAHLVAGSTGRALSDSLAGSTAPSAQEVADAVWDEAITDHTATGSTGAQLAAAGASGDPWATVVPGAYGDGTAGAAVGRLNNTPAENPVAIVPVPPSDPDLAVVYVDTEDIVGEAVTDAVIKIRLESTQPVSTAEGRVVSNHRAEMAHDPSTPGRYTITLETGLSYRAISSEIFGPDGKAFSLAADAETLNLAD